eukprot:6201083-Pleurochrysis_carterae.AAC.1
MPARGILGEGFEKPQNIGEIRTLMLQVVVDNSLSGGLFNIMQQLALLQREAILPVSRASAHPFVWTRIC